MIKFQEIVGRYKGDSLLYAGMCAYLLDKDAQAYAALCLDDDGRTWRYPEAARTKQDPENATPTSRDMWMGALLASTTNPMMYLHFADYLVKNEGKLCPDEVIPEKHRASKPNHIKALGWAYMLMVDAHLNAGVLTVKQSVLGALLLPFVGLIDLLSSLTVYRHYQLNLIYCSLLLRKRCGYNSIFTKLTLRILRELRGCQDGVLMYLEGANWLDIKQEEERTYREQARVQIHHPTLFPESLVWAPGADSPGYGKSHPHRLYSYWLRAAKKYKER
jgi:hypothetical protein